MIERQIHLDFHTSPEINDVAQDFNATEFGRYFAEMQVDSVTVFARDHHGWLFYQSKHDPKAMHPHNAHPNLLSEQIDALHQFHLRAPIYTTVQWDHRIAQEHPEWLCRAANGQHINNQDVPQPNFYDFLCLASPYQQFLLDHVQDIIDSIGKQRIDGFFFDIVNNVPCTCPYCQKRMAANQLDWHKTSDCLQNCADVLAAFKDTVTALIKSQLPAATIFFNSSHVGPDIRRTLADYSQLEIESLPNGAWGYDNFSRVARYARTLGKPYLGMTGKFHTYWGDFHSLKRPAALEYECYQMVSLGAGCSIGDQLLPSGRLLKGTSKLITPVYQRLAKISEVLPTTKPITPIAILSAEQALVTPATNEESLTGAVRLLETLHQQFNIIDQIADFTPYTLIIIPDRLASFSDNLIAKLTTFVANGGFILASDQALVENQLSSILGVNSLGPASWDRDFIIPNQTYGKALVPEEYVMYETGTKVEATTASAELQTKRPYFNRHGHTFTSHQHAPSNGQDGCPALWRTPQTLYFTHPIFHMYYDYAPDWILAIFQDALTALIPSYLIQTDLPNNLRIELRQADNGDLYLHLLNYWLQKTGKYTYSVEPGSNCLIGDLRLPQKLINKNITTIKNLETDQSYSFVQDNQKLTLKLTEVNPYQIILCR
ncbi:alpha-amylase family protein [Lapidilactobacillus gannanensis]|uniref:Beta-galactosidase trimerisation domain-containing protein n=1 Tax=Lapidilactobacillus gannanensis TaxID=2486002 RepID=A0ABW4BLI6_9LACO|nr:alpha-amylase family protein [Lapidilactobacillus gannanensis]